MSKKEELCKSCGGGLSEFEGEESVKHGFCPYCADKHGNVRSYKEILEGMIEYIKSDHPEIADEERQTQAEEWLKETEVWGDKFAEEGIVVDNIRESNFAQIPEINEKYPCNTCMYYQDGENTVKSKKSWLHEMQKKHGISCGRILYVNGEAMGFAQFAPKSEFPKLEELSEDRTEIYIWYISCLIVKGDSDQENMLVPIFLKEILEDLRKHGAKKVQICANKAKSDALNSVTAQWNLYKEAGFEKIGEDEEFVTGEFVF